MKKLIIFLLTVLFFGDTYAQDDYTQLSKRNHHLNLSRKQNLAGIVALGIGAVCIGAGVAKQNQTPWASGSLGSSLEEDYNSKGKTMIIIGSVFGAASIPLFFMAAKNKKKANSIEVTNQPVSFLNQHGLSTITQPALAIKIAL